MHTGGAVSIHSMPTTTARELVKQSATDKGAGWWGIVDSLVAIRSQLLLCLPDINNTHAGLLLHEPRDSNVTGDSRRFSDSHRSAVSTRARDNRPP